MNWRYNITIKYDPTHDRVELTENGMAKFPGSLSERRLFLKESKQIALYWMGMEYDIFPIRKENGTIGTEVLPSEREQKIIEMYNKLCEIVE